MDFNQALAALNNNPTDGLITDGLPQHPEDPPPKVVQAERQQPDGRDGYGFKP